MFSKFQFMEAVKNPLSKIKASFKDMITKQKVEITEIIPNKLYHISPLNQNNIDSLLQTFKSAHQFQLWNIGEYSYPQQILTKLLEGRERNSDGKQIVYNLTYEYFANIPFSQMIKSIQSIEAFLSLSPNNRVYVHCQDNKRRSAVFLASYIFLTGLQTDIVNSILTVNKKLNISIEEKDISQNSGAIYKSQHLVLKNLMNYINNSSFINRNLWNLKKVLLNNAPKIHSVLKLENFSNFSNQKQKQIKFKVLLQIRSAQGIIYKKIFQDEFIEGESLCLRIPQDEKVVLKDDFLIIIKYVHEKKGYSILRSQLNTNFIYDPYFRVQRNDMDLSVNNAHPQNQTVFMDLLLESNSTEQSELSKLNILKENNEGPNSPSLAQTKQGSKKPIELQNNTKNQKQHEQDEDGFGILDEEQEAEHNQKMQREIEEELARQLQNIRKKRTQDGKKTEENNENVNQIANKKESPEQNPKTIAQTLQSESKILEQSDETQQVDNSSQTKNASQISKQNQVSNEEKILEKSSEISSEPQSQEIPQDQIASHSQSEGSSDQQSQQSESSSEDQGEQGQEDLEDYLTKLQKQAEKHD